MPEDKKPPKPLGFTDIAKIAAATARSKKVVGATPEREQMTTEERKKRVARGIKERAAQKRKDIQKMGEQYKPRYENPFPMTEEAKKNMAKTDQMLEIKRKRAAGKL
jgi:hypothetical protein